jgi:UDP-N-acetylmuramoyl-tripeptide--D-alanyl-D-alanine ligase
MAELGDQERAGHEEVGRLAAELGVDRVVAVAENARPILDGANGVSGWTGSAIFAENQAAAIEIVKGDLRAGDVVLVKGSRYRTWDVVDSLRPDAGSELGEPRGHSQKQPGPARSEVSP